MGSAYLIIFKLRCQLSKLAPESPSQFPRLSSFYKISDYQIPWPYCNGYFNLSINL